MFYLLLCEENSRAHIRGMNKIHTVRVARTSWLNIWSITSLTAGKVSKFKLISRAWESVTCVGCHACFFGVQCSFVFEVQCPFSIRVQRPFFLGCNARFCAGCNALRVQCPFLRVQCPFFLLGAMHISVGCNALLLSGCNALSASTYTHAHA